MAGWSSLPGDLVNNIADRLLATDDLDYYMDFRAVCRGWRSSTADPKNDSRRFWPRQWAMLDEVYQSAARLFVNVGTGRFVRKDLPQLDRYFVVTSAAGGSVVLAERTAPHAARVLNPFTGATVSFEAPVPSERKVAAYVIGSSPTLVLLCGHDDDPRTIYWADPDSKSFMAHKVATEGGIHFPLPAVRVAIEGGIYAVAREDASLASRLVPQATKILELAAKPLAECFAGVEVQHVNRCFLVESAGEMLIVLKLPHRLEVCRVDTGSNLLERVKNLGIQALFVGDCRCLSVDADRFASVEANSVYYVVKDPWYDVCVYSLKDEREVRAGGAIDSLNPFTVCIDPPFSEVQLLCCYTFEIRYSELGWHQMFSRLHEARLAPGLFDEFDGYFSGSDDF